MKTVLFLRHAKSKRGPQYHTDFERPLAKRGKRDAPRMGQFLAAQDQVPDLILSSPAERARQTALRCADAADYMGEIRFDEVLYLGGEEAYLALLEELDDTLDRVLFVGHNPDIEIVIEMLCGEWVRMPTAALARIDLPLTSWSGLSENMGRLCWVQYPREID